jgi:hypothetical protein
VSQHTDRDWDNIRFTNRIECSFFLQYCPLKASDSWYYSFNFSLPDRIVLSVLYMPLTRNYFFNCSIEHSLSSDKVMKEVYLTGASNCSRHSPVLFLHDSWKVPITNKTNIVIPVLPSLQFSSIRSFSSTRYTVLLVDKWLYHGQCFRSGSAFNWSPGSGSGRIKKS